MRPCTGLWVKSLTCCHRVHEYWFTLEVHWTDGCHRDVVSCSRTQAGQDQGGVGGGDFAAIGSCRFICDDVIEAGMGHVWSTAPYQCNRLCCFVGDCDCSRFGGIYREQK